MISISNVNEIEKIIRQTLITQSELDGSDVLNALSIYGTTLDKLFEEHIFTSVEQSDSFMLFELMSRDASSDISMDENDAITYYKAFKVKLIIYGNSSSDIALKLCSRLRTEEVRANLYEQGIYLEKVSDPYILNEYKNETMWLRNDIDIDIAVKYTVQPITVDNNFSDITELNIIKEEEV